MKNTVKVNKDIAAKLYELNFNIRGLPNKKTYSNTAEYFNINKNDCENRIFYDVVDRITIKKCNNKDGNYLSFYVHTLENYATIENIKRNIQILRRHLLEYKIEMKENRINYDPYILESSIMATEITLDENIKALICVGISTE